MKRVLVLAMTAILSLGVLVAPAQAHQGDHSRFHGWFTFCDYTHSAYVDPIVNRGERAAHKHDFFGGQVTKWSTDDKLLEGPTSCTFRSNSDSPVSSGDHSGYWAPTLWSKATDQQITPIGLHVYPRTGVGIDQHDVSRWTPGAQAVFRDNEQGAKYRGADLRWYCADDFPGQGNNGDKRQNPYNCTTDKHPWVSLEMITPGCMKRDTTQAADYFSHYAYSTVNGCPSTHPKAVPEMRLVIKYKSSNGANFTLHDPTVAPGDMDMKTMDLDTDVHIDFFAAWKPTRIERLITQCIHQSRVCGNAGDT